MKALYDFDAKDVDELSIKVGQLIDLVREGGHSSLAPDSPDVSDWWTGRLGDKVGLFPRTYVEKL